MVLLGIWESVFETIPPGCMVRGILFAEGSPFGFDWESCYTSFNFMVIHAITNQLQPDNNLPGLVQQNCLTESRLRSPAHTHKPFGFSLLQ